MVNPMASVSNSRKNIVIIGAGIVGVSTAIWLQRAGHRVTVVDPKGPAGGTSYGNAGVLASIAIVPVTVPGLLGKAPKMLLDKNSPLFMRWSYLPKLLPFLSKYLPHANDQDTNRIADALTLLLQDSADQHVSLAKGTGAEKFVAPGNYLFGYESTEAFDKDAYSWEIRHKRGYDFQVMTGLELANYDPSLQGLFSCGVKCPEHGQITDPGAYVKALAGHVDQTGGKFIAEEVVDLNYSEDGQPNGVITEKQKLNADDIVLAAGIWSGPLATKLGVNVQMEAERGYHIEFVNPSVKLKSPIMVASGKFVMTPMEGRLRCAGIVEFGGMTETRSRAPLELLKRQTLELLPNLKYDRIDEWMGFRPSTPDSLPLIGRVSEHKNVWLGFGHQHIGLTAGPKTGRWIAQMIDGKKPNIDLKPFSTGRFLS